jgi:hypothetical protein
MPVANQSALPLAPPSPATESSTAALPGCEILGLLAGPFLTHGSPTACAALSGLFGGLRPATPDEAPTEFGLALRERRRLDANTALAMRPDSVRSGLLFFHEGRFHRYDTASGETVPFGPDMGASQGCFGGADSRVWFNHPRKAEALRYDPDGEQEQRLPLRNERGEAMQPFWGACCLRDGREEHYYIASADRERRLLRVDPETGEGETMRAGLVSQPTRIACVGRRMLVLDSRNALLVLDTTHSFREPRVERVIPVPTDTAHIITAPHGIYLCGISWISRMDADLRSLGSVRLDSLPGLERGLRWPSMVITENNGPELWVLDWCTRDLLRLSLRLPGQSLQE